MRRVAECGWEFGPEGWADAALQRSGRAQAELRSQPRLTRPFMDASAGSGRAVRRQRGRHLAAPGGQVDRDDARGVSAGARPITSHGFGRQFQGLPCRFCRLPAHRRGPRARRAKTGRVCQACLYRACRCRAGLRGKSAKPASGKPRPAPAELRARLPLPAAPGELRWCVWIAESRRGFAARQAGFGQQAGWTSNRRSSPGASASATCGKVGVA